MTKNSDIKCLQLFSTPILTALVPKANTLNKKLKTAIYQQKEINPGTNRSNIGGWHSKDDLMVWAKDESQQILTQAMQMCTKFTTHTHPTGKRDFRFNANMWANINQKGNSNRPHCHPGCLWSGVYYVDDGLETTSDAAGGHLVFEDPRFPMNAMYKPDLVFRDAQGAPQRTQHLLTPKSGMIVMFPSWIRHSVRPYKGSKDRISVAFNLMVKDS